MSLWSRPEHTINNLIYYTSFANQDFYKMSFDGSDKILLRKTVQSFNVTQGYIYYTKRSSISRLTVDGKNDTEIYNAINQNSGASARRYKNIT